MRKICYVTGTRADFGLMEGALHAVDKHPCLSLSIVVTGMHLLANYGNTINEIEASRLPIVAKVPVMLSGSSSGAEMASALGEQVKGMTNAFQQFVPDVVLVLGDRGEMLAAAISALYLNIPIVHIHGGERSGTVDEPVRHAISKLSHYHFTATEEARERLIRMGEAEKNIYVTGAPGLDSIVDRPPVPRAALLEKYELDSSQPFVLVAFHPVVQRSDYAGRQVEALLNAVLKVKMQALVLMPNADAGGADIGRVIGEYDKKNGGLHSIVHVERNSYLSLLAEAEVLVGNSSSGIIEAATLATPVVNIGTRQNCRERNANVIDSDLEEESIVSAIQRAAKMKGMTWNNVYGDGKSSNRMVKLLAEFPLSSKILEKVNAY